MFPHSPQDANSATIPCPSESNNQLTPRSELLLLAPGKDMFPSWRSSVLLALLFLIALILVLPQVDLPDYLSSDASLVKVTAPHLPQSSTGTIFDAALPLAYFSIHPPAPRAISLNTSGLRPPVSVTSPELRC